MAQIGPFAHVGTQTAAVGPRCFIDHEIRQIKKFARFLPCFGQVFFDPQQFWRLLLGRHRAPDILQYVVSTRIDAIYLIYCAVIAPHDDVALGFARFRYGQGLSSSI